MLHQKPSQGDRRISPLLHPWSVRGQPQCGSPDGEHIVFSTPGLSIMDPAGSDVRAFPSLGVGETALADWTA
jgi:hypothetical protein